MCTQLFPYHLAHYICGVLRVTPFKCVAPDLSRCPVDSSPPANPSSQAHHVSVTASMLCAALPHSLRPSNSWYKTGDCAFRYYSDLAFNLLAAERR